MSKVGIEVNLNFDRFNNFIDEFSKLAKKHDLVVDVDEEEMKIIINLNDLVDVQTSLSCNKRLSELKK